MKLEVQARESVGSAEARRLRAQGFVPGVIYGAGEDAQAFCVGERDLRRAITGDHGMHAILDVVIAGDDGKARHAVLKDYQLHPTKNRLLHIDLHEVRLDRPIQASVVVELTGESEGSKMGGVVSQTQREVTVEALPMSVPDRLELDISHLQIGDSCRVSDLMAPEDVTILDDPEAVLVTVFQPRVEEEPEPEEGEELEGEEGVEGEGVEGAEGEEAGESEAEASGESGDSEE
jgi:large subunit ribosomal protein L25